MILNEAEEQRLDLESQISRLASENNLVSSPVSVNSFSRALFLDFSEFVRCLHKFLYIITSDKFSKSYQITLKFPLFVNTEYRVN